jgi:hypothetical protein
MPNDRRLPLLRWVHWDGAGYEDLPAVHGSRLQQRITFPPSLRFEPFCDR